MPALLVSPLLTRALAAFVLLVFRHRLTDAQCSSVDVIKVRMQADRSGKLYRGVGDAFGVIYRREGLRGFLRGMPPNIQRGFIVNAAELSTYDHSKEQLIASGLLKEGVLAHTGASCVAGFAGAAASNPYVHNLLSALIDFELTLSAAGSTW